MGHNLQQEIQKLQANDWSFEHTVHHKQPLLLSVHLFCRKCSQDSSEVSHLDSARPSGPEKYVKRYRWMIKPNPKFQEFVAWSYDTAFKWTAFALTYFVFTTKLIRNFVYFILKRGVQKVRGMSVWMYYCVWNVHGGCVGKMQINFILHVCE